MANFQNCAARLPVSAPASKPGETATSRTVALRGGVHGELSPILTSCLQTGRHCTPSKLGAAANTLKARSTEDPGKQNESMRRIARFRSHTVKPNSTQALDMMAYPETTEISLTPHVECIYVQPRP